MADPHEARVHSARAGKKILRPASGFAVWMRKRKQKRQRGQKWQKVLFCCFCPLCLFCFHLGATCTGENFVRLPTTLMQILLTGLCKICPKSGIQFNELN
jgi:hypothetical protein